MGLKPKTPQTLRALSMDDWPLLWWVDSLGEIFKRAKVLAAKFSDYLSCQYASTTGPQIWTQPLCCCLHAVALSVVFKY